jgi:hypothetical protein
MKNKKRFLGLLVVTLAMLIVFGACDDGPGTGQLNISGNVVIPNPEVMMGMTIIADTDGLAGSTPINYVWQIGDPAAGTFSNLSGATNATFMVDSLESGITVGRFIRVIVTRDERVGSRTSNAAIIREAAMINSVEIEFDEENVMTGGTYNLKANVKHDGNDAAIFQQVIWSLEGQNSINTTIGKYTGNLEISGTETSLMVTVIAKSIFDLTREEKIALPVGQTPPILLLDSIMDKDAFEVREAEPERNGGRDVAFGFANDAFFIENAKADTDGAAGRGRYEIYFYFEETINASLYRFLTFEISADNIDILQDIDEHYPRFRDFHPDDPRPGAFVQFFGHDYRRLIDSPFHAADPFAGTWGTVRIPIDNLPANIHENSQNFELVMTNAGVLALRFITKASGGQIGKIYFRNLRLHMMDPGL